MNESEFKKRIAEIKKIKLTPTEKSELLKRVLNSPTVSPYISKPNFWSVFFRQRQTAYVFAALFAMISLGSVLAYEAEKSLPGENLYFIKVGITEPVRDRANLSPENKAQWESVKTIRRLEEALDLAAQGKLN